MRTTFVALVKKMVNTVSLVNAIASPAYLVRAVKGDSH